MDLRDATLVILTESGDYPGLAQLAQSAYDELTSGHDVAYPVLSDMIGEASGKGVLRALRQKYSPVAFDSIITPILKEIGRQKPVPPRRRPRPSDSSPDPLTADIRYVS
jgi:hypothetical protein